MLKAGIIDVVTRIAMLKSGIPSGRADTRQYAIYSTKHCVPSVTLANRMKPPRGVNCTPAIVSLCSHLCRPVRRMTETLEARTCTIRKLIGRLLARWSEFRGWVLAIMHYQGISIGSDRRRLSLHLLNVGRELSGDATEYPAHQLGGLRSFS